MSKGLKAFEEILSSAYGLGLKTDLRDQLIVIEEELKEHEKIKDNYKQIEKSYDLICEEFTKAIDTIASLLEKDRKELEFIKNVSMLLRFFEHKEELKEELL